MYGKKIRIHIQYKITDSIDMTPLREQEKETKSTEQTIVHQK